ncbi:hypothetical protein ACPPVO_52015 [Dactylosporangium sp. McL0621]|uniref:hypothetical protein n=1 Tax=Dactylosporangium sp. McL0621 TaxID=3415678 RepID=UPI003CEDF30F
MSGTNDALRRAIRQTVFEQIRQRRAARRTAREAQRTIGDITHPQVNHGGYLPCGCHISQHHHACSPEARRKTEAQR